MDSSLEEPDLRSYLAVIARRRWLVILVTLLCVAVAAVVSLVPEPRYRVRAQVLTTGVNDPVAMIFGANTGGDLERQAKRGKMDPHWYHRARTAVRHKRQEIAALAAHMQTLPSERKAGFKDCLIEVLRDEFDEVEAEFATPRVAEITGGFDGLEDEDLIEVEDMVVTVTMTGYIKRTPLALFREQKRGGKGVLSGARERRAWGVGDGDGRGALGTCRVEDGDDVGRSAGLADADHEGPVEPRRNAIERHERRRGEGDRQAVQEMTAEVQLLNDGPCNDRGRCPQQERGDPDTSGVAVQLAGTGREPLRQPAQHRVHERLRPDDGA